MNPQGQEAIQFFTLKEGRGTANLMQAKDAVHRQQDPAAEYLDRTAVRVLVERRSETSNSGKIPPSPLFIP